MNKEIEISRIYEEGLKIAYKIIARLNKRINCNIKRQIRKILTTDNPLSNRGAMAICCRVLLSALLK